MSQSEVIPQFKLTLLIRRRPDLTHEQFKARYESGHAPLARMQLPLLRRYQRNYLTPLPGRPDREYDVITEFWFDTMEDLQATIGSLPEEVRETLARDEAEFMDRPSMSLYITETHRSPE